jgi:hypothetical protein
MMNMACVLQALHGMHAAALTCRRVDETMNSIQLHVSSGVASCS